DRVLYWTGGHPYMTQRLCQAIAEDSSVAGPAAVDRHCTALFLTPQARTQETTYALSANACSVARRTAPVPWTYMPACSAASACVTTTLTRSLPCCDWLASPRCIVACSRCAIASTLMCLTVPGFERTCPTPSCAASVLPCGVAICAPA